MPSQKQAEEIWWFPLNECKHTLLMIIYKGSKYITIVFIDDNDDGDQDAASTGRLVPHALLLDSVANNKFEYIVLLHSFFALEHAAKSMNERTWKEFVDVLKEEYGWMDGWKPFP